MCMFCGSVDPSHDLIVQAVIAGGITTPWMLRDKLLKTVKRALGRAGIEPDAATCALVDEDSEQATDLR
jgi:hypothetical protein